MEAHAKHGHTHTAANRESTAIDARQNGTKDAPLAEAIASLVKIWAKSTRTKPEQLALLAAVRAAMGV